MGRIAWCYCEFRRGFAHHLHHPMAVQIDLLVNDFTARIFENRQGFFIEELNPNVFQNFHRTFMDGQNAFFGQWLNGTICVLNDPPRHLFDGASVPAGIPGATTAAASWPIAHFCLQRLLAFKMNHTNKFCGPITTFYV